MGFGFEKLEVYQKALEFMNEIYVLTRAFPKDEQFGLTSQLRRAAVSIAANISEGSARSKKDFARFIDMSRGSIYECLAILQIASRQNYFQIEKYKDLENRLTDLSKMLSGLKRALIC
ncbi:MAG: four helix bundle protein [Candidatus Omnitrophota bacterium]